MNRFAVCLCLVVTACGGDDDGAAPDAAILPIDAAVIPPDADLTPDANPLRPGLLSQTGLYSDIVAGTLATGVQEFQPQYILWTDGATKRRWVLLPQGTQIDTSDMDFWSYPVGTKLWKEFSRDGKRVETRILWKQGPTSDDWYMMAYHWKDDQTDAVAVRDGVDNASGTNHDIPGAELCRQCHERTKDISIGFTAVLLDHNLGGLNMEQLVADNRLTVPPMGSAPYYSVPGSATAKKALGYLHVNCGGCHNEQSPLQSTVKVNFRLAVDGLKKIEDTAAFITAVGVANELSLGGATHIINPGDPSTSAAHIRMNLRSNVQQMPPLGTEDVDATGLADLDAWIVELGQ